MRFIDDVLYQLSVWQSAPWDFLCLFIRRLFTWFLEPEGNLAWDFLLQALGIIITVAVIERYIERREAKRWEPAKHLMYVDLFNVTELILQELTPNLPNKAGPLRTYAFGEHQPISALGEAFLDELDETDTEDYEEPALWVIERRSDLLREIETNLRDILRRSSNMLELEPELSALSFQLESDLGFTLRELASHVETGGEDDIRKKASAAVGHFELVVASANKLRRWLEGQATDAPHEARVLGSVDKRKIDSND